MRFPGTALSTFLRQVGLYHPLRDWRRGQRFHRTSQAQISQWRSHGCPAPAPDYVKYGVLRDYARRHHCHTLVETGTFYGNAPFTLRYDFTSIHTIELATELYELNRAELGHLPHVQLHYGDSATVLPRLLPDLPGPTLFWLDGHFCAGPSARGEADTPISAELELLLARPPSADVILIDDARLFLGDNGYPSLAQVEALVRAQRPSASCTAELDIIRIAPV